MRSPVISITSLLPSVEKHHAMSVDYRPTVFQPKTDFPMRAGLPQREPETLARWRALDLFARQRELSAGREKFILHDGPPYATGHLHLGPPLHKHPKNVPNTDRPARRERGV